MDDMLTRFWNDLIARPDGPMGFRFILQPLMAILYATRDGVRDAHAGRPAYFWSLLTGSRDRRGLLREGWAAVGRVILLGLVMDAIYQIIVFRWIYPTEMIVIALTLAFVPYLLWRGPANRIARHWRRTPAGSR